MKKIGFVTNFNVPDKAKTAFEAAHRAHIAGAKPLFPQYVYQNKTLYAQTSGLEAEFYSLPEVYALCDVICVIGGDGSVIEACKRASEVDKPVLGINRGRIGYTSELEPDEVGRIDEIVHDKYYLDERFMLDVSVKRNGEVVFSGCALNEAFITNGTSFKVVDLRIKDEDAEVAHYRADGIIISTPTGSTAYSLSAGGPVIDPRLECFCITPICAHSPTARPLIFPKQSVLKIENVTNRNPDSVLVLDGKSTFKIENTDTVEIKAYHKHAKLIRIKPRKHYQGLCKKLD